MMTLAHPIPEETIRDAKSKDPLLPRIYFLQGLPEVCVVEMDQREGIQAEGPYVCPV